MRINFILPRASLSGGARVIATYARHLMELGHEVIVISHKQQFSPAQRLWKAVKPAHTKKVKPRSTLLDFMGGRHITVDQGRPESFDMVPDGDVVVATWWNTAPWVAKMAPEKGRKFYLLQDYEMFDYTPHDEVAATYQLPLRKLTVSGYIRDCLAEYHGIPDVPVIPNSVDLDQFNAPVRSKNKALTVGFLYTSNPRKRASLAVEAAVAARARWADLQVCAFGGKVPNDPDDLPGWITYHIDPPQTEIPGIYAGCDLWLFPSEAEGFGLPMLEAMACRTPVAAASAGAAPDLIDDGNGILVAGNCDAFVAAIGRFRDMDDAQWQGFSQAAWQRAHAYRWEDATRRLLSHFTDITDGTGNP